MKCEYRIGTDDRIYGFLVLKLWIRSQFSGCTALDRCDCFMGWLKVRRDAPNLAKFGQVISQTVIYDSTLIGGAD
jgi:hypothetical protein